LQAAAAAAAKAANLVTALRLLAHAAARKRQSVKHQKRLRLVAVIKQPKAELQHNARGITTKQLAPAQSAVQ
jgi:hypothetical protein